MPRLPQPYGEDLQVMLWDGTVRVAPEMVTEMRLIRCAVIVDANPAHHKANLKLGPDGSYAAGCRKCYDALAPDIVALGSDSAEFRQAVEEQEEEHKRANAVDPDNPQSRGDIRDMPDLNTLGPEGEKWARFYAAARPAARVIDLVEVVDFLREASDQGRHPINVVACISHGVTDRVFLGGEINKALLANNRHKKNVRDFIAEIRDFLAPDVRWILYACLTAGEDPNARGIYPNSGGRDTLAAEFLNQLAARGKNLAEVWGHVGAGPALARPYWRRFRSADLVEARPWSEPLVTLFDYCFPPEYCNEMAELLPGQGTAANDIRANAYSIFKDTLGKALRAPTSNETLGLGLTHVEMTPSVHIPMWTSDPDISLLDEACQEAWREHRSSSYRQRRGRRR